MSNITHLDPSQVSPLLRGSYTGRKFKAVVCNHVELNGMQWSGGTCYSYHALDLATGARSAILDPRSWPDNMKAADPVELIPGKAIIQHCTFLGKDTGLTFYIHPDNALKLLPPPGDPVDIDVQTVCVFTAALKNTYGGRTDIRFTEANLKTGIDEGRWRLAQASGIQAGYLRKNGSITPTGRNVAANSTINY